MESTAVTRAGMMVGTPFYMSPEHIRGGLLDGRSDVFAMGVILHELFAGARPFTAEDPTRVLYRIVNEPHPRLQSGAAGILTGEVQRVIDKALEKDADSRYASAAQMADALARVRERCPSIQLADEDGETLGAARKTFAAGRTNDTLQQSVETIARRNPEAADAHRLSRAMKRKPLDAQAAADTAVFPELDATFAKATSSAGETAMGATATINGRAETILQGSPSGPGGGTAASPSASKARMVWIGGVAAGVIVIAVAASILRNNAAPGANANGSPRPTASIQEVLVPTAEPVGSRRTAGPPAVTNAARPTTPTRPPSAALANTARPPAAAPGQARPVPSVPPAAPGSERPAPAPVEPKPVPAGPPSTLVIESSYPVTVSTAGRVLASEKTVASVTLSAGSHEIFIESAAVFLRKRETVQLEAGGSFTIRPPGTGKIGVRANPDNCKVFIDGVFVDYPPILDHAIAAGSHVISFEWPGGARSEERVLIQAGKPSYVMGRKP